MPIDWRSSDIPGEKNEDMVKRSPFARKSDDERERERAKH